MEEKSLILRVHGLNRSFGGVHAVRDYEVDLPKGKIVGLIGPNGAGKTTIFNLISGILRPDKGKITLDGKDITGYRPDLIARMGITRTFQNLRLFSDISVSANVKIGGHKRLNYRLFHILPCLPKFIRQERSLEEQVETLLDLLGLVRYKDDKAGELPYGLQRKVEIARALAASPSLLLLDEPSAGMNPKESQDLAKIIEKVHEEYSLTMVIIEHRMPFVMGLASSIQVLNQGSLIAEGKPEEVRNDPKVIKAYLGADEELA